MARIDDVAPHRGAQPARPLDNIDVEHEHSDVNVRAILAFIVALIISAIVVHVGIWLMFDFLAARADKADPPALPLAASRRREPSPPRLQGLSWGQPNRWSTPVGDLKEFRRAEEAALNEYGWIDRNAGVVRIPIERAIELIAARGVEPAEPAAAAAPPPERKP